MDMFKRISCHHFVEIDGYAYFSNWFYNGLFQVELKTGRTMFLGSFGNEARSIFNMHWELLYMKDMIYFFPRRGRHIHIYSLIDRTISAIEFRRDYERFYRIGEVIVDGLNAVFLPMEKDAPIKQLDLSSKTVTEVANAQGVFNGIRLSESWPAFPEPQLLAAYQIERADRFSWLRTLDGKWCAFLPMRRHLLWYTPEMQKIEAVPLDVINEESLTLYQQLIQQEYLDQGKLLESNELTIHEYLKIMGSCQFSTMIGQNSKGLVGQDTWCLIKNEFN